jgi:hypothetical protein
MGLIINVYRAVARPDCTNGGVSGQFAELTLVNVDGPFDPDEQRPAAWLVRGNLPFTVKIVVVDPATASRRPMMGGNYGGTCDSRFSEAVQHITGYGFGVVPIHDRYED